MATVLRPAVDVVTRAEFDAYRRATDARLAALEAAAERRPAAQRTRQRAADSALLMTIAQAANGLAFSSAELLRHAHVDDALREALTAAGLSSSPRRLGKALARSVGATVGDRQLRRIGADHGGAVWCFVRV